MELQKEKQGKISRNKNKKQIEHDKYKKKDK